MSFSLLDIPPFHSPIQFITIYCNMTTSAYLYYQFYFEGDCGERGHILQSVRYHLMEVWYHKLRFVSRLFPLLP